MIGWLYREYKERTGAFYDWNEANLLFCFDQKESKNRYDSNSHLFQTIEITIPPQQNIKVRIPIWEEWEEDTRFEERVLSDIRIDPKSRVICNKILESYKHCYWWYFVKKQGWWEKMHTKNMEVLQLMKDVIMWFIRYEPIRLKYEVGKWNQRKQIQYDWDITENFKNATYTVWWKKYKTDIYWVYTRKLRKSMFTHYFKFYWDHEFQYFQREFDLNYWALNYFCASRDSWKSWFGLYEWALPLFKSKTSLREFADPANLKSHFFVKANNVIDNMSAKLKEFFYNLLVKTYKLDEQAANQIVEWKNTDWRFILHQEEWDRTMEFVSELATSKRWERSWRAVLDESNYLKNFDEVSEFATKSGAPSVFYISTISQDSKGSKFYNGWVNAIIKNKSLMPIDEVIHHVWTKFWFDKIKSAEDYKQMALDWILDQARTEFFKLRPSRWQKTTIDQLEYLTEDEKKVKVQSAIDSVTWYDWMLAEYYCELSPETAVIRYKPNILDEEQVPRFFEKIYAWYDVADSYDEPSLVVWWLFEKRFYIIEEHSLPKHREERFEKINEILWFREKRSEKKPSLIVDIGNWWPMVFLYTAERVKYCDMAIRARTWSSEKVLNDQWVAFYQVWTDALVKTIMNTEMIAWDRLFFSAALSKDDENWLFTQLDWYIKDSKWTYKWRWHKHDDKVTALLYVTYYVYMEEIKWEKTMQQTQSIDILNEYTYKLQQKELILNSPKKKKTLWKMR